jgi:hypothetical protein
MVARGVRLNALGTRKTVNECLGPTLTRRARAISVPSHPLSKPRPLILILVALHLHGNMDLGGQSVVLPASTISSLSLSLWVLCDEGNYQDSNASLLQTPPTDPKHLGTLDSSTTADEHFIAFRCTFNLSLRVSWSHLTVVLGALLGTQNGREVEIVNTFEVAIDQGEKVDHASFNVRKEQCALAASMYHALMITLFVDKQVFPSLEFIGWYTVAIHPTQRHITLHEQVRSHFSHYICPIMSSSSPYTAQTLSF